MAKIIAFEQEVIPARGRQRQKNAGGGRSEHADRQKQVSGTFYRQSHLALSVDYYSNTYYMKLQFLQSMAQSCADFLAEAGISADDFVLSDSSVRTYMAAPADPDADAQLLFVKVSDSEITVVREYAVPDAGDQYSVNFFLYRLRDFHDADSWETYNFGRRRWDRRGEAIFSGDYLKKEYEKSLKREDQ